MNLPKRGLLVSTVFMLLVGCTRKSAPVHESADASEIAISPDSGVAFTDTIQMASRPVDSLKQNFLDSEPKFAFRTLDSRSEFIFVDIDRTPIQSHPAIIIIRNGKHRIVELDDGRFINHGWVRGYISRDGKSLWAVTDGVIEDPAWDINIVHTLDAGATWVATSIHKPTYMAGVDSIRMRPDGSGELAILYDDYGDPTDVPAGYYLYTTRDWGSSWSAPVHVPDILTGPNVFSFHSPSAPENLSDHLKDALKSTATDH